MSNDLCTCYDNQLPSTDWLKLALGRVADLSIDEVAAACSVLTAVTHIFAHVEAFEMTPNGTLSLFEYVSERKCNFELFWPQPRESEITEARRRR
eukprot:6192147-Pleurochrysis_carterae.AAC.4